MRGMTMKMSDSEVFAPDGLPKRVHMGVTAAAGARVHRSCDRVHNDMRAAAAAGGLVLHRRVDHAMMKVMVVMPMHRPPQERAFIGAGRG
jgi:limonene-1,2-epoxide hydrolase